MRTVLFGFAATLLLACTSQSFAQDANDAPDALKFPDNYKSWIHVSKDCTLPGISVGGYRDKLENPPVVEYVKDGNVVGTFMHVDEFSTVLSLPSLNNGALSSMGIFGAEDPAEVGDALIRALGMDPKDREALVDGCSEAEEWIGVEAFNQVAAATVATIPDVAGWQVAENTCFEDKGVAKAHWNKENDTIVFEVWNNADTSRPVVTYSPYNSWEPGVFVLKLLDQNPKIVYRSPETNEAIAAAITESFHPDPSVVSNVVGECLHAAHTAGESFQ